MTAEIALTDVRLTYLDLAEARKQSGLRLILGKYTVPGPWREACKGLFYVKKIPYASVVTAGQNGEDLQFGGDGSDRELREWTGQSSAPVAVWNDEPPRATWFEQIHLAERLAPHPRLIPDAVSERALMFGYCNELAGENGLAWSKRLDIIHRTLAALPADDPGRAFWQYVGAKYRYSPTAAAAAHARIARILVALDRQLAGRRYFFGDALSALDIFWATFCALLAPLPETLCPMATVFRTHYSNADPAVAAALTPALLAHRDFIYREYLELPVAF